jgi:hypothetical protein
MQAIWFIIIDELLYYCQAYDEPAISNHLWFMIPVIVLVATYILLTRHGKFIRMMIKMCTDSNNRVIGIVSRDATCS